jgi:hypothetical protein
MLSGTGYPSGENYLAGTGMELFFYPHADTGNPTGKILRVRVRVRVGTTRRVHTRCHLCMCCWIEFLPLFSSQFHPQILLCKKKILHHIKMSANAWSTKYRWNKKLIIQFCYTLRDEHFESN